MAVTTISGDLLASPEDFIGHQCNCVTKGAAAGLANALFARFPFADVYADRERPSEPGTYSLHGEGKARPFIVNLYAQYNPGKPRGKKDSTDQRLEWLLQALKRFVEEHNPAVIALPYGIGCGLAGGDWATYHRALERFSTDHSLAVHLYKL